MIWDGRRRSLRPLRWSRGGTRLTSVGRSMCPIACGWYLCHGSIAPRGRPVLGTGMRSMRQRKCLKCWWQTQWNRQWWRLKWRRPAGWLLAKSRHFLAHSRRLGGRAGRAWRQSLEAGVRSEGPPLQHQRPLDRHQASIRSPQGQQRQSDNRSTMSQMMHLSS